MRIHAIQTGVARMKPQFRRGNADRGMLPTMLSIASDTASEEVPIYAWLIEHDEGLILVDTGAHAAHTFVADMVVHPEEGLGRQLERLGVAVGDIAKVMLTHLHEDHVGGLDAVRDRPILVSEEDHKLLGRRFRPLSRLSTPAPSWLRPSPLVLVREPVGCFAHSAPLTRAGDVMAVPTPGHTPGHLSVVVRDGALNYLITGDATYSEAALLAGRVEGISFAKVHQPTTRAKLLAFARSTPTVLLPSHDWDVPTRLAERRVFSPPRGLTERHLSAPTTTAASAVAGKRRSHGPRPGSPT
jgi:glyoxylase-like metal-dependent hydrolase (beta-lactamase superfamily II)